jgi:4-hydroxymandelate oxidase
MHSIEEIKEAALEKLEKTTAEYICGGSGKEITLQSNLESFHSYSLLPKVLSLKTHPTTHAKIQNTAVSFPMGIAPSAYHKLAHSQGESATCKAARDLGTIYIASCLATTSLSQLEKEGDLSHVWLQILTFKDKNLIKALIKKAERTGCAAIVVTVDAPVSGNRKRDTVNRFSLPSALRMEILHEECREMNAPCSNGSMLDAFFETYINPLFSWEDLASIISSTHLPVIVKGILRKEDARLALKVGAKGVIVSNHGGRQLDQATSSLHALEEIAGALKDQIELYVDGGFRSGVDVFKALALGAKAVFLGRPVLWGLSVNGEEGIKKVFDILHKELLHTMYLTGTSSISEINCEFIGKK